MKTSQKKYSMRIGIIILLCSVAIGNVKVSNPVKIATIGTNRIQVSRADKNKNMQQIINQVIALWKSQIVQVLPDKPDLIVLPENCDLPIGLTQEEKYEYLRVRKTQITDYFASVAKANNCYVAFGSLRLADADGFINSGILIDRKGEIAGIYNKNFPTISEIKDGVKAGSEAPVFQCDFGRVAFAVCFDLNFSELREQYEAAKPDIILFPSAYHGGRAQGDWAYQCRSFFVGSIGSDRTPSEIINPLGEVIASNSNYFRFTVATINLDSRVAHLGYNFAKLRAMKTKYGDAVTVTDPGKLGAVLLSSQVKDRTIDQMVKEFDIELIDDYFNRSRKVRLDSLNE